MKSNGATSGLVASLRTTDSSFLVKSNLVPLTQCFNRVGDILIKPHAADTTSATNDMRTAFSDAMKDFKRSKDDKEVSNLVHPVLNALEKWADLCNSRDVFSTTAATTVFPPAPTAFNTAPSHSIVGGSRNLSDKPLFSADSTGWLIKDVLNAIQEIDGLNAYSSAQEAMGYILNGEQLMIPSVYYSNLANISGAISTHGTPAMISMLAANYYSLVKAGHSSDDSYMGSILRFAMVQAGLLAKTTEERCVFHDEVLEYDHVAHMTASGMEIKKFADMLKPADIKFCQKLALPVAHITSIVFWQTGHHWTVNTASRCNKLLDGLMIDRGSGVTKMSEKMMFRTAVHPFGIRMFYDSWNKNDHKVADNLKKRIGSFPAGAAVIGTAAATIKLMKSAPFWSNFYALYKAPIDELEAEVSKIHAEPHKYHINAPLFYPGATRFVANTAAAEVLAPALQAFINTYCRDAPIAGQKSLMRPATENAGLKTQFENGMRAFMETTSRDTSIIGVPSPRSNMRTVAIKGSANDEYG